jgi:centromeric protein E
MDPTCVLYIMHQRLVSIEMHVQVIARACSQSAKINQSLLALARVIEKLAEGGARPGPKQHVPFRDSNLTRLLQPCLGGNSKTAIIGTVSPAASALENTKATLKFIGVASKVCCHCLKGRYQILLTDYHQMQSLCMLDSRL